MDLLDFLHGRIAAALIAFAVVLGIWGTYQFLRYRRLSGGFRSSYILMIGLTGVEGVVGLITLILGQRPHEILHVVYGIFAIAFLPGVYFYSERRDDLREAAFLAAACWIVAIAYGRAITTGGG